MGDKHVVDNEEVTGNDRGAPGEPDFDASYAQAVAGLGRTGVLLVGETGAGKSTLINAIFGSKVAATGVGLPVTAQVRRYETPDGTLVLFDSPGAEVGAATSALEWVHQQVSGARAHASASRPDTHPIDVVWFCVSAYSGRITAGQIAMIKALSDMDLPVLLVMTQVPRIRGRVATRALEFQRALEALDLPTADGKVHLTSALADPERDEEVFGLEEVVEATSFRLEGAHARAFAAAQQVDLRTKARQARKVIAAASAAAGGIGASPLPFADAPALVTLQLGLMVRISHLYGVSAKETRRIALSAGGVTTIAGRQAVAGLLRLIPGAGSVVSGSVAATLTATVGEAWRVVCERVHLGTLDLQSASGLVQAGETFVSGLGVAKSLIKRLR